MSSILYKNNCVSTISSGIDESTTSFYIDSRDGSFPKVDSSTGNFFIATIVNSATNESEIVKVNMCNPSTGAIICERGYEGTDKLSFPLGSSFELRITAGFFKQLVGNVAATPFFAWRMESPSSLPEGWIALDGAIYNKTSAIGSILSTIPASLKNNWNFRETDTTIQVPNFYTLGTVGAITSIADKSVGKVTYYQSSSQANVVAPSSGISSGTKITDFTVDEPQEIIAGIHMTPAIYIGI